MSASHYESMQTHTFSSEAYKEYLNKYKSNIHVNASPETDHTYKRSHQDSMFSHSQLSPAKMNLEKQKIEMQQQITNLERAYIQKKAEAELWKQKYEQQVSQNLQNQALIEIKNVQESQIHQVQQSRVYDIQNKLANGQVTTDNKVLNNMLTQKNQEIQDLIVHINKLKMNHENQILGYQKELDSLKVQIYNHEVEKSNELITIKERIEQSNQKNIETIKSNLFHQSELKDQELAKLKGILEIKNEEINTLIGQNQRIKANYEEECHLLRKDIELLKSKIIEGEQIQEVQTIEIQQSLENIHNEDLNYIKNSYMQSINGLQSEIEMLMHLLEQKKNEVEFLKNEKEQILKNYELDINNLKCLNEDYVNQISNQQQDLAKYQQDSNIRLEREQANHKSELNQLQGQLNITLKELENARIMVKDKNIEIETIQNQQRQIQATLELDIQQLHFQIEQSSAISSSFTTDKDILIEKLTNETKMLENQIQDVQNQYEIIITHLNAEYRKIQEQNMVKVKESETLHMQKQHLEQMNHKQLLEIQNLQNITKEFNTLKAQEIEELKYKMDQCSALQFDNLKSAYNTQIRVLQEQIQDLQSAYDKRNKEYQDFVEKFMNNEGHLASQQSAASRRIMEVMAQSQRLRSLSGSKSKLQ